MVSTFVIFFMIATCQAQVFSPGPCKEIRMTPHFDPSKLLGHWYIFASTGVDNPKGKCREIEYVGYDNSSTMIIETLKLIIPGESLVGGLVNKVEYIGDAMFLVTNSTDSFLINRTVTFWNIDYTSYAVRGTCQNVGEFSLYVAWILTRSQHPSSSVIAQIDEALEVDRVPMKLFRRENQMDCPKNV